MTMLNRDDRRLVLIGMFLVCWLIAYELNLQNVHAQFPEPQDSVAIVTNVAGTASINSLERAALSEAVTMQGPLVYGDRVETAKNSILSMLVGTGALVSVEELSEVSIEREQDLPKVIHLVLGTSCISTKGFQETEEQSVSVKTPTTILNPTPGSMFRVKVSDKSSQKTFQQRHPKKIFTRFESQHSRFAQTHSGDSMQGVTETIQVMYGSVEVVSQVPGVSPITVYERFQLNIRNGKISRPTRGSVESCQIQDLQRNPQHTANPKEIRHFIAQKESTQASDLVAALFETTPPTAEPTESGVIISTTDDPGDLLSLRSPFPVTTSFEPPPGTIIEDSIISTSVPNLVEIEGKIVEINESTLRLNNSAIPADATNENIALVSVSSGGLLRGISTDPVISLQDSQTTTQSTVNIDASLLEASAPLLAASSPNIASQLTTSGNAVQVSGSQLVASLPADALALIQLDGSSLTATGSLFNVTGGGILTVSGNLVGLTNGSQLGVDNLVALSGGSSFGLIGGSLLFGDGSSTASINNTLCAGGGCAGGFVSAPAGNTVTIAPNFQPTQGIDVSPDAALIVVNGTGNTVVLNP